MSPRDTLEHCQLLNERNARTARRAEAAVWLITALGIGMPLAWCLVEWFTCGVC